MFTAADAMKMRSSQMDKIIAHFVESSDHLTKAVWVESENDRDPISHDSYDERVAYIVAMLEGRGFKVTYTAHPAENDEIGAYTEITFSWADANVTPSWNPLMDDREFEVRLNNGTNLGAFRGDSALMMSLTGESFLALTKLSVGGSYRDVYSRDWKRVK